MGIWHSGELRKWKRKLLFHYSEMIKSYDYALEMLFDKFRQLKKRETKGIQTVEYKFRRVVLTMFDGLDLNHNYYDMKWNLG